ncbi:SusC/RagA family TonB-linked outer membrane protein [Chitinophaga lutea]
MLNMYLRPHFWGRWALLCLFLVPVLKFAFGNDTSRITLHVSNQPIESIFKLIEKQTGLTFYYGKSVLDGSTNASINVDNAPLSKVMDILLAGKKVAWQINKGGIILSRPAAPSAPAAIVADSVPKISVSGTVVDKSGNPLVGATVTIRGEMRGQGTDNLGRFSFVNVPVNATLVVSSIGFDPKQVKVGGQGSVRVALDSAIRDIQAVEVVSTGYQTIPKERATGSFSFVSNETLNRTVSTNLLDRFVNSVSSLKLEKVGTANTNITIRGISTINANMVPLVVIDGFPLEEGNGKDVAAIALKNLNPNDIESVTVLKDAAAASIWGARSGNGVIVITTKKGGFNRKPTVQFTASINLIDQPDIKKLPLISSESAVDYEIALFNSGFYNAYNGPFPATYAYPIVSPVIEVLLAQKRNAISKAEADKKLAMYKQHDIRDDIDQYFLQRGVNQQYSASISGGSDRNSYYASLGYDRNRDNIVRNASSRFTLRIDNTFRVTKSTELGMYVSYVQNQSDDNGYNYARLLATGATNAAPYTFLADENGAPLHVPTSGTLRQAYIDTISTPGLLDWHSKPIDELRSNNSENKILNTRIGGSIKQNIIKGISLEIRGQYEKRTTGTHTLAGLSSFETRNSINRFMFLDASKKPNYPVPIGAISSDIEDSFTGWNFRALININKTFGDHNISAIAGAEAQETSSIREYSRKYGFDPITNMYNSQIDYKTSFQLRPSSSGRVVAAVPSAEYLTRFRSYFANAAYTLLDKYTVSTSGKIDASNAFGIKANQRNIPLWSTGASWDLSRESFFRIRNIEQIKLRFTYGYNANRSPSSTALPIITYSTNPASPYTPYEYATLSAPPNVGLTWERIRTTNTGLDFSLFKNRLNGSIEYYTKYGMDLIGIIPLDPTYGTSQYTTNYGSLKGKGLDVTLNAILVDHKLKWRSAIIFSTNKDKVINYYLNPSIVNSTSTYLAYSAPLVGQPLFKIYAYRWAGLDPKNGNPQGYLADTIAPFTTILSSQGAKPKDLRYVGNLLPKYFGSFLNTVSIEGITLSWNIVYKFGHYFRRPSIDYNLLRAFWGGHADYESRWRKPGDEGITTVPSNANDTRYSFYSNSEVLVEKGDFIRLQDIRVEYQFRNVNILGGLLSNSSVFIFANNVGLLWTANNKGLDPEAPSLTTPVPRAYAAGINARF